MLRLVMVRLKGKCDVVVVGVGVFLIGLVLGKLFRQWFIILLGLRLMYFVYLCRKFLVKMVVGRILWWFFLRVLRYCRLILVFLVIFCSVILWDLCWLWSQLLSEFLFLVLGFYGFSLFFFDIQFFLKVLILFMVQVDLVFFIYILVSL